MELQDNDASDRYKLVIKLQGRGNSMKTKVDNIAEVCKALGRSPALVTRFFGCELGVLSSYSDDTNTAIVNGSHDTEKLAKLLDKFIAKYVLCYECKNPETELKFYCGGGGAAKKATKVAKGPSKKNAPVVMAKNGDEDDQEDDDGVEWQTDPSKEAAQERLKEQLSSNLGWSAPALLSFLAWLKGRAIFSSIEHDRRPARPPGLFFALDLGMPAIFFSIPHPNRGLRQCSVRFPEELQFSRLAAASWTRFSRIGLYRSSQHCSWRHERSEWEM
ncbi:probable eukaryotic translation initiation factor 5-1 [Selaginella moellendorffii]|uniref:probable eukaryotic translation initiation factor 5-1 n=1 Tax=Selaginella moellendorffii TaxID=88036 RepID=UPI000D1C5FE0|nr:probable eukaryotic translation initiation factor 5-1 [Selaginella moellendorffii]|eukprot:XP_024534875.1 probable eukaryotic translation initiation factor 5-1 [Selaginella moellendorffii]